MSAGRHLLGFLTYGFTICVIAIIGAGLWATHTYIKPGAHVQPVNILIKPGDNIARRLQETGLIHNEFVFKLSGRITGQATRLKAGEYEIPPRASIKDILSQMEAGKTIARRFTVREGLTSFETVALIRGVENLSGEIKDIPPEGSLLPNTYDYQLNEPRSDVLTRLQSAMSFSIVELCKINKEEAPDFQVLLQEPCGSAPLKTVRDVLTLASIVEKETAQADERAKVAGVFINRLKRGIPLQTDPTVIYAITKGKHKNDGRGPLGRRLLKKDLKIDSPYNTYVYPGLPPGPIANPGRASIEAVLAPETHDYIYFVADGTGGHAFARTLKEHNANVAKWRKIRREKQ